MLLTTWVLVVLSVGWLFSLLVVLELTFVLSEFLVAVWVVCLALVLEVCVASVELLAVALLLALLCWTFSVALVAFWVLVCSVATSLFVVALVIASFALSAASVAAWFNLSLVVWSIVVAPLISLFFLLRASSMALLAAVWLAVKLGTFTAPIALIPLVCSAVVLPTAEGCCNLLFARLLEFPTLSVVAAFTEWFVKLIPKMVTPNNTEATPTLSLRKL